ncbi:MAG TPA: hypothetical protein VM934_09345 [Pyrinomonadaceae bacterium]|nr:hypothetical protein [Pyrinomonadaceae bacterium]
MQRVEQIAVLDAGTGANSSAWPFALVSLALLAAAATFAGFVPLRASIFTVFLFAGPHNWFELRYFLARLPARWGRSRNFFVVALAGAIALTIAYAALPLLSAARRWDGEELLTALAVWNSLLILWVAALVLMRGRQTSRRDWSWAAPVGLALVGLNWMGPQMLSLGMVYAHPLVALWFLDRHLKRTRPEWRRAYHLCLTALPLLVVALWSCLWNAPPLAGDDALTLRITDHAGASILNGFSSRMLVATHVFLETTHYSVWLVAMPLVGLRVAPWRFDTIPLVRNRRGHWPRLIRFALLACACVVVLLWLCFLADYTTTRDVYFTVAMMHVLAEVPFLLRML